MEPPDSNTFSPAGAAVTPPRTRGVALRRANETVIRFMAVALVWITLSAILSTLPTTANTPFKVLVDLAFLAFAVFYFHKKVLRALAAAENADRAYRAASVELIERLALVGEHRDDLTGGHARRIGRYAGVVARRLGMTAEESERIELAATLHDIGKVGISDSILNKSSALTSEEYRTMQEHVQIGARMLEGGAHPLLQTAHLVALSHHENWDGTGYPSGLAGESIPLVGRIVAVCDVFDALISHRPYKRAWTVGEALAEIWRLSGTKFDPIVVEAFMRCHEELNLPAPSRENYGVAPISSPQVIA